jgi:rare lipoprotein A
MVFHPDTRVRTTFAVFLLVVLLLQGCSGLARHESRPDLSGYRETGLASYYAKKHQHRKTASGEPFNNNALTAAHKSLPFGTRVMVKNLNNGRSVTVRINDRGPFVRGRIIDLTRTAFSRIASLDKGVAKVEIRVVR